MRALRCIVLVSVLAATMTLAAGPSAMGAHDSCAVMNVTRDRPAGSNLQAAIDAAHAGDTLRITGTCHGGFVVDHSLTLTGPADGVRSTLGGGGSERALTVIGTESHTIHVTLKNLRIVRGRVQGYGGGLRTSFADVHLKNTLIRHNDAGRGGGIWSRGRLTLWDSRVTENSAGGIHAVGRVRLRGHTSIDGNENAPGVRVAGHLTMGGRAKVQRNQAYSAAGVLLEYPSRLLMRGRSTIRRNVALSTGGGVFGAPATAIVLRDHSSLRHNVSARDGGGIFTLGRVSLRQHAQVTANSAGKHGGGIFAFGAVRLSGRSLLTRNLAQRGAGIHLMGAPLELSNHARVIENRAAVVGGGVLAVDYPAPRIRVRGQAAIRRNDPQDIVMRIRPVEARGE